MKMSKTWHKPMVEWKQIDWRKAEKAVFKLQKRIYKASQRGDIKAIRKLQKTLMKSWHAKCLAVRRVTQDNRGKSTAGVDGIKCLSPAARLKLVNNLKLGSKVKPTRRVWIPKPGSEEKRPLGIPVMNDRALQALIKLVLEPEWEARFEPNSYGFRPGRSYHDAIGAIFNGIKHKNKFVLDADIAKCFDRINHEALLKKLNTFPTISRQVRAWLKAGVMDGKQLFPTSEGTPQGGVISPLLSNIALHGMEKRIEEEFPMLYRFSRATWFHEKGKNFFSPILVRYADDFVIIHEDLTVVQRCREVISEWLKDMGLELKPSKTRLTHTMIECEGEKPGFNFLGFNVRQFKKGKYHTGKRTNGEPLGFKTLITPSKEKQKVHYDRVASIIDDHKGSPQCALIGKLNPVIKGWSDFYSAVVSKKVYSSQDNLMYSKLRRWAKRRHPKKTRGWVARKYWRTIGDANWVFAAKQEGKNPMRLRLHGDTLIVRHAKIKSDASPYDGNLIYWSSRRGTHPEVSKVMATLLKTQKGKCAYCGLYFREEDVLEVDHIIPQILGGKDDYKNLQILHRHCHDRKTAEDGSTAKCT